MPGQHQVEHDQVGGAGAHGAPARPRRRRPRRRVLGGAQVGHDDLADGGVVVDDQHRATLTSGRRARVRDGGRDDRTATTTRPASTSQPAV